MRVPMLSVAVGILLAVSSQAQEVGMPQSKTLAANYRAAHTTDALAAELISHAPTALDHTKGDSTADGARQSACTRSLEAETFVVASRKPANEHPDDLDLALSTNSSIEASLENTIDILLPGSLPELSDYLPVGIPLRAPPEGAHLVQFRPSSVTRATVPLMVSDAWAGDESVGADRVMSLAMGHLAIGGRPHVSLSKSSPVTSAYAVIHGRNRNGGTAFKQLYHALNLSHLSLNGPDASSLLVAPTFYVPSDAKRAIQGRNYFDPSRNLAWPAERDKDFSGPYGLFDGADAICPASEDLGTLPGCALSGAKISTFDVMDALLVEILDENRYPYMKNITFVGHSAGAESLQRWSFLDPMASLRARRKDVHFRVVLANAPSSVYPTIDRPDNPFGAVRMPWRLRHDGTPSPNGCDFRQYRYGYVGWLPRYVKQRVQQRRYREVKEGENAANEVDEPSTSRSSSPIDKTPLGFFCSWIGMDVVRLVGTLDIAALAHGGDQSCASRTQGGPNRRDRNYAYWAYSNHLASTGADVSQFWGSANLSASIIPMGGGQIFAHRLAIVDGVGHRAGDMYSSVVGRSALVDAIVQQGPRPPPMPMLGPDGQQQETDVEEDDDTDEEPISDDATADDLVSSIPTARRDDVEGINVL